MAFDDLIRSGVALADRMTDSLQPTVLHYPWTGSDGAGGSTFGAPVPRKALLEKKNRRVVNAQGEEVTASTTVTFLRPVAANGAAGRTEPIDPRDRYQLPGSANRAPALAVDTFADPDSPSGGGYFYQVYLA